MVKRKTAIAVIATLGMLTMVGGTFAYFRTEISAGNTLSTGTVDVKLQEKITEGIYEDMKDSKLINSREVWMPGEQIDKVVVAKNQGNRPIYVRIGITKEWDGIEITGASDDWIVKQIDKNHILYYGKKPISPGEYSSQVMDKVHIFGDGSMVNEEYAGQETSLTFMVEAVQKSAGKDAILVEWGMDAEVAEDGTIRTITQRK
ncbi:MAG: TasA family protein [Lachnospiraceae bacterium]